MLRSLRSVLRAIAALMVFAALAVAGGGAQQKPVDSAPVAPPAADTSTPQSAHPKGPKNPPLGRRAGAPTVRPSGSPASLGRTDPEVGGVAMYPTKTIVENAVNSPIYTTLVAAVKAAGLVDTLSGPGPFTVFAPTNDAFAKLPPGVVDMLLNPENKVELKRLLTYHVVPGRYDSRALLQDIREHEGKATLKTVDGRDLTFTLSEGKILITDDKGDTATITTANVYDSNGVVHVIDSVLQP